MRAGRWEQIAFAVLTLVGLVFWGGQTGIDGPFVYHVDEVQVAARAFRIAATGELDPQFLIYPHLVLYLEAGVAAVSAWLGGPAPSIALDPYHPPPLSAFPLYASIRWVSVLATTGTMLLVALLTRRLFGAVAGLVAGLVFLGSNLVRNSAWHGTVDATLVFFVTAGLFAATMALADPRDPTDVARRGRWIWLACAAFALATATKYNGALCFAYVPFLWRSTGASWPKAARATVLGAAFALLIFAAVSPFVLVHVEGLISPEAGGLMFDVVHYASGHEGFDAQPAWRLALAELHNHVTRASVFAIALPFALRVSRQRRALFLLLAHTLLVFLVITRFRVFFPRNVLPLVPAWIALLVGSTWEASCALAERWRQGLKESLRRWLPPLGAGIVLAISLAHDRRTARAVYEDLTLPDTRSIALEWMERELPKNVRIMRDGYAPHTELLGWPTVITPKLGDVRAGDIAAQADVVIASSTQWARFERSGFATYHALLALTPRARWEPEPARTRGPTLHLYDASGIAAEP